MFILGNYCSFISTVCTDPDQVSYIILKTFFSSHALLPKESTLHS